MSKHETVRETFSRLLIKSLQECITRMQKEKRSYFDILGAVIYLIASANTDEDEGLTEELFESINERLSYEINKAEETKSRLN